jgi:hypothetical protein
MFRAAVDAAEADEAGPGADTDWVSRERWRDYIRSWWIAAQGYYRSPNEVPRDWIYDQRERDVAGCDQVLVFWLPEREAALPEVEGKAMYAARYEAKWKRVETLISAGAFWPLHLDPKHLLRAQFDTIGSWGIALSR